MDISYPLQPNGKFLLLKTQLTYVIKYVEFELLEVSPLLTSIQSVGRYVAYFHRTEMIITLTRISLVLL